MNNLVKYYQEHEIVCVDGYGVTMTAGAYYRLLDSINDLLNKPIEPIAYRPQEPWKDKPAGQYEKGSGV